MISYPLNNLSGSLSYTVYSCNKEESNYERYVEIRLNNQLATRFYYHVYSHDIHANYFIELLKTHYAYINATESTYQLKTLNYNEEIKLITNGVNTINFVSYSDLKSYKRDNPNFLNFSFLTISANTYSPHQPSYSYFSKEEDNNKNEYLMAKAMLYGNYYVDGTLRTNMPLLSYEFYSFKSNDSSAPLEFEYCLCEHPLFNKAILIYQNEDIIAKFFYYEEMPTVAPISYQDVLKFLKDKLLCETFWLQSKSPQYCTVSD